MKVAAELRFAAAFRSRLRAWNETGNRQLAAPQNRLDASRYPAVAAALVAAAKEIGDQLG